MEGSVKELMSLEERNKIFIHQFDIYIYTQCIIR